MPDKITHEARTGRRSWLGYARIFRSIHDGIDTAATLAPIHGLRTETMRELLRRMCGAALIHICGEVRAANRLRVPRWAIGPGAKSSARTNAPLVPNIELAAFADMWRALQEAPHTPKALAERRGISRQRVGAFLAACHAELRILRVAGYESPRGDLGGGQAVLYAAGFDQPDTQKPAREPMVDRWRRERETKKRRARWAADGLAITPQTLITIYPPKPAPLRTNTHAA